MKNNSELTAREMVIAHINIEKMVEVTGEFIGDLMREAVGSEEHPKANMSDVLHNTILFSYVYNIVTKLLPILFSEMRKHNPDSYKTQLQKMAIEVNDLFKKAQQ